MNDFTATNDLTFRLGADGRSLLCSDTKDPGFQRAVTVAGARALDRLREYFRAEEDDRLGRWRWPEEPHYVVYHSRNVNGDHKVLDERDGQGTLWGRDMAPAPAGSDHRESAARAYFDAHPERKPWHAAKPGEAWLLVVEGQEMLAMRDVDDDFFTTDPQYRVLAHDRVDITDGRRIWPESS
jgi:hypothetical protein